MSDPDDVIGTFVFDDHEVAIQKGDTIGVCLMRAGLLTIRHSKSGEPRGMYCAIGVCNECLVTVDGAHNVRACVTVARPGAVVQTMGSQE
jgi:predicted molibdopterin-dependent oxidoreductase YjgC